MANDPKQPPQRRSRGAETLVAVCTPLLLYLTSFRRNSAAAPQGLDEVRASVAALLEQLEPRCAGDARMLGLLSQVRYALVVSCDQLIASSSWSQKQAWAQLSLEAEHYGTQEADERFFLLVDEALEHPGEDGAEMAELLFECMALGFQGALRGDRAAYEARRLELYEKARVPLKMGTQLTPAAYDRNSDRSLLKMPNVPLSRVILVALCTIFSFLAIGYFVTDIRSAATTAAVNELRSEISR